ncbi:hypothetical protein IG631_24123 [Alternaria alternata]|nr:hypothetical protein IG631_24123 [Alternaria alternata]
MTPDVSWRGKCMPYRIRCRIALFHVGVSVTGSRFVVILFEHFFAMSGSYSRSTFTIECEDRLLLVVRALRYLHGELAVSSLHFYHLYSPESPTWIECPTYRTLFLACVF